MTYEPGEAQWLSCLKTTSMIVMAECLWLKVPCLLASAAPLWASAGVFATQRNLPCSSHSRRTFLVS